MEPIRTLIADDERIIRRTLRSILSSIKDIEIVEEASNGQELKSMVSSLDVDLIMVDIDMPEMDGLNAVKEICEDIPEIQVIFVTGYSQYAAEAYNISAVDYITKPIDEERVKQAIGKVRKDLQKRNDTSWNEMIKVLKNQRKVSIRSEGVIYFIPHDDIILIQKNGQRTELVTKDKKYVTYLPMGKLFCKLDSSMFFRCHNSYIINVTMIKQISAFGTDAYEVVFEDINETALISRSKIKRLYQLLEVD